MKTVKCIDSIDHKDKQRRLKEIFILQKQLKTTNDMFQLELQELRTKALERKQLIHDKRDKLIAGELEVDELAEFDQRYQTSFIAVEQVAQNIVRLEEGTQELIVTDDENDESDEGESASQSQQSDITLSKLPPSLSNDRTQPKIPEATETSVKETENKSVLRSTTQGSIKNKQLTNRSISQVDKSDKHTSKSDKQTAKSEIQGAKSDKQNSTILTDNNPEGTINNEPNSGE